MSLYPVKLYGIFVTIVVRGLISENYPNITVPRPSYPGGIILVRGLYLSIIQIMIVILQYLAFLSWLYHSH